jgi:DNA-binding NtrC family response regulator
MVYRRRMSDDHQRTRTMEQGDDPAMCSAEGMIPGVVGIFSQGQPINLPIPVNRRPVEIGRGVTHGATKLEDDRTSRRHTEIEWRGMEVRVTDLGSRNHTFIDGKDIQDEVFAGLPRILRIGNTLFRFAHDIRPFLKGEVSIRDRRVIGPTLRERYKEIVRVAVDGETLLLTGPSGSGKELAAQAFHEAGNRGGRFVAVNCATIPANLAESLLFGARRGAYSGATDTPGYVQTANGGTLFLDEIAELDASVQAKLLRVLETHEVMALGASAPRKVDIRVCTATLKNLRAEVAAGRFREDLYHRISTPEVRLPSLVERLEELPWLACAELQRMNPQLVPSALFLEACALRPWPGNVRELLRELRNAGRAALNAGRFSVDAKDLSPSAGQDIAPAAVSRPPTPRPPRDATPHAQPRASSKPPPPISAEANRDAVEAALQQERGNVTGAARVLGVHRNQLRRWLIRLGIDPATFGGPDGDDENARSDPKPPPGKA